MNKRRQLVWTLAAALLLGGCTTTVNVPEQETEKEAVAENTQTVQPETTAQEEIQPTETQEAEPLIQTVTLTATGDCTLGATQTHGYAGSFHEYYDKYGQDYFFDDVRDIFEKDDFTLVNLECVLTESTDRVEKTWNLKGKPEYVGIMTGSSVEGCSLGNNHTLDYGPQSLTDTENVLDQAGIVYGYNEHVATYTTESGIVIGIVSANLLAQTQERANYIRDGIKKLREEGADLVIACCHWGIEEDHYPNDYQKTTAHQIIDWGADAVIGNHPHVLQGVELYEGKMICYSLGNFCFGGNRNPQVKDTAIFQQTFTFVDGELQNNISAKMIPCTISSTNSVNDFQPTVASGERKATIIEELNEYSKPYSELQLDAEGTLYLGDKN